MKLKNTIFFGLVASLLFTGLPFSTNAISYSPPAGDSLQDFHIDKDGNIRVNQAKIIQVAGTTFYVRYYVGAAFIKILVKTDTKTKTFRRFGDEISIDQIVTGDIINIEGQIENGADNLSVVATKLTNFSNQKEIGNFKGTIAGMGSTTGSFILNTKNGNVTITTGTSTQIKKGSRIIGSDLVKNGDTVTDVVGIYDHKTKTIDANVVVVYINKKIFAERNFEGLLKSISAENPPTLIVNLEGKDYSVILTSKTTILNKNKRNTSLKRYLEGDTVRVYGAIREAEEPIIDAQIVRNTSLQ